MKKLIAFIVVSAFVVPILVGCGEAPADKVDSSNANGVKVDSKGTGKKGAMENDKGLTN